MDSGPILKKEKFVLLLNVILGIAFLAAGIFIEASTNNKTVTAISFIPVSLAISSLFKIINLKKNPRSYVEEYDERIIAAKNRADAMSLRALRYILFLVFLAYTFNYPKEIFESLNWWLILLISLITVLLPIVLLGNVNKNYSQENKE